MKDFMSGSVALARNPLGIIGLFVCLVYGLACAVLLINGRQLMCGESWALVSFVVVFPFVILAVFYALVTRHHKKLYAPSDYKDERNFLLPSPLPDERISERIDQEVAILKESAGSASSGFQRNAEKNSLDRSDFRSEYGNSERLAFLAIEKKIGKSFDKYVGFNLPTGRVEFDGYLESKEGEHLIEVEVLSKEMVEDLAGLKRRINSHVERANAVWGAVRIPNRSLWLAFVYDFPKEELRALIRSAPLMPAPMDLPGFNLNVHYLNLDELKETYG